MRKSKNKSKSFKGFKRSVWLSGFLLIFFIGQLIYFLLILSRLPNNLNRIILIFFQIFLFCGLILEFYTNYCELKWVRNSPDLTKKTLKFEKALNIQVNKLLEKIKMAEGKVRELEGKYILLEKDELLKANFENQKEKHQFQNYKIKIDNLKDSLQEIKKNYDENIKPGLKILWTTKPRTLMRKIKRLSKAVNILSTQSEKIELNKNN